ncbi:hypothetical protein QZH41_010067, partial [Actinostola sp. cb2023]
MSKALEEYGSQKSTSISTAKRLAEFLGDQMVKDKGLSFVIIVVIIITTIIVIIISRTIIIVISSSSTIIVIIIIIVIGIVVISIITTIIIVIMAIIIVIIIVIVVISIITTIIIVVIIGRVVIIITTIIIVVITVIGIVVISIIITTIIMAIIIVIIIIVIGIVVISIITTIIIVVMAIIIVIIIIVISRVVISITTIIIVVITVIGIVVISIIITVIGIVVISIITATIIVVIIVIGIVVISIITTIIIVVITVIGIVVINIITIIVVITVIDIVVISIIITTIIVVIGIVVISIIITTIIMAIIIVIIIVIGIVVISIITTIIIVVVIGIVVIIIIITTIIVVIGIVVIIIIITTIIIVVITVIGIVVISIITTIIIMVITIIVIIIIVIGIVVISIITTIIIVVITVIGIVVISIITTIIVIMAIIIVIIIIVIGIVVISIITTIIIVVITVIGIVVIIIITTIIVVIIVIGIVVISIIITTIIIIVIGIVVISIIITTIIVVVIGIVVISIIITTIITTIIVVVIGIVVISIIITTIITTIIVVITVIGIVVISIIITTIIVVIGIVVISIIITTIITTNHISSVILFLVACMIMAAQETTNENERCKEDAKGASDDVDDDNDCEDGGGRGSSQVRDIEDMGSGTRPSGTLRPMATKRKRDQMETGPSPGAVRSSKRSNDVDLTKSWKEVLTTHLESIYGGYLSDPTTGVDLRWEDKEAWVAFQKKKWEYQAKQRAERKRLRQEASSMGVTIGSRGGSNTAMTSFIRQQARSLLNTPWQIVQIAETGALGVFKVWALIGSDLHAVKVNIPRIFYVNCRTPREGEGATWRPVSKTLPRSHAAINLYEYSVPENIYREHSSELATELSSPNIEGVYESQVPLITRALIKLGCVASVNKTFARISNTRDLDVFELDQLEFKTLAECSYLDKCSLKTIYLYHSQSIDTVYFVLQVSVFVLDTVRNNQMPNLTSLYNAERSNKAKSAEEGEPVSLPPENHTFEVRVDTNPRQTFRAVQRFLHAYKEEKSGPTMILIQSSMDLSHLTSSMPALNDFPLVPIPYSNSDAQYNLLDWQRHASRRMISHYLEVDTFYQIQLENARYFHVPVGNLPMDATLFAADLFYSRHLQKHGHLLWMSPTNRPDLGGKEEDDNRLSLMTDEAGSMEFNSPGCFPTVCVELSIDGLAVNTILQSAHINDFEGASGTGISFDNIPQASLEELVQGGQAAVGLTTYDEAALCSSAFSVSYATILKGMIHSWLHEVSAYQNQFADAQLMHFYRWLSSPNSLLYDPALCRMVQRMMKKLFLQLVGEFKRLGSTMVYASFSKIIICTKKRSVSDAMAYVEFILRSIQSKDLFHSIDIVPTACWEYLMWLDQANHGGVRGKLPDHSEETGDNSDDEITATPENNNVDEEPQIEMNWNIGKYLPAGASCQNFFQIVVAGHIHAVYKHSLEERRIIQPGTTPIRRRGTSSQSQKSVQSSATPSLVTFAQERIQGDLTQQLFSITQKIQHTLSGDRSSNKDPSAEFPILPGSYLPLNNPALEFVKYICKADTLGTNICCPAREVSGLWRGLNVLSLDSNTQHQVNKLRRDLLKLIGVGEFSAVATFQDPCLSFVLPEVICQFCNACRDLDLCRDPYIVPAEGNNSASCYCPNCQNEYDMDAIEHQLITAVQKRSMAHVLQDLKCAKCGGVSLVTIKDTNMSKYCKCGASFTLVASAAEFAEKMRTFRSIARWVFRTLYMLYFT